MTNIFPILSLQTMLTVCHDTKTEQNAPSLFYYLLSTFIDYFFYNNVFILHIALSAFIDFNCILFYHCSINFIKTIRLMSLLKKIV